MKIVVRVTVLACLLCLGAASGAESRPDQGPVLRAPAADSMPAIDGKLDEPCWKKAVSTGALAVTRPGPAKSATQALVACGADHLYIALQCTGSRFTKEAVKPGEPPKPGEFAELLISSGGDRNSYYLIRITPEKGGPVTTSYNEHDPPWCDRTWQPKFDLAVASGDDGWTAEMALPLGMFNKNKTLASEIGFNVRRAGMAGGESHCWRGTFTSPSDAGTLSGIPARENLPEPEYGLRGLTRWYRPPTKAARSFLAEEQKQSIQLGPGSAHPGTTGEVKLELEGFLLAGDPHACGIIWDLAVDEQKGEVFVLSDTRPVRGVAELRVFDRRGDYLRTIMPLNPNLPRLSVQDLCRKTAREGDAELIVPKQFMPWAETSMYGDWWHHPQKIVRAKNGDLILSNIFRGTLWRLKPDGSLPAEGWTSTYHRGRHEPFDSTVWTQEFWHCPDLKNYLPFHALHYPYFCLDAGGALYVSAGQSSRPTKQYAYHYEVGEEDVNYHWPLNDEGQRGATVWKCGIQGSVKLENKGAFHGFAEPSGLVFDRGKLIVADAGNNRLQVLDEGGRVAASLTHYRREDAQHPLYGPTALAIDRERCLYVLVGAEKRPADPRAERTLALVQQDVHAAARKPPPAPRTLLKLKSWEDPQLLAVSGPLHPDVLQIAVDGGVSPPLVWVANGSGPGRLLQLAGNDLAVKADLGDNGQTLSCPRQDGGQPVLNIDPLTGQLYIEDDSNYRLKQYGTVYRIDPSGNVLKKWPPAFFNTDRLNATSPWWLPDPERHFRFPNEPLSIDSVFGKDGRIYRWRLGKAGAEILRFDRSGNPIPFKATGTHVLFMDPAMEVNFWHDVYHGMDVDRHGNIFYVAKVDADPKSRPVSAYSAMHRQVNVYDADGNLRTRNLLRLECVRGIQVDDQGNLYALYRPATRPWEDYLTLAKFSPSGGEPLWSRRWEGSPGEAQLVNPPCHCSTFRFHQTLDGRGYLYAAGRYSVQVIDCKTGKLVGEFGSYGNRDCQGKGSPLPHPELPFGTISALSVWKDRLFVVDVLNRRIVKCRIVYGAADK